LGANQNSTSTELKYTITGNNSIPFMLIAYTQYQCSDTAFGTMNYWPLGVKEINRGLEINTFPNPFHSDLFLNIKLSEPEILSIQFVDVLGNIVWQNEKLSAKAGEQQYSIPTNTLNSGIYYVVIKGNNFNKILRAVHQ
jgi:hypothetical protein